MSICYKCARIDHLTHDLCGPCFFIDAFDWVPRDVRSMYH